MIRSAALLTALFILPACAAPVPNLKESAWRLELPGVGGGSAVPVKITQRVDGPGFLVIFLTAKHVSEHAPTGWEAHIGERALHGGFVVAAHPLLDLAVIAFPTLGPLPPLVPLATRSPCVGDTLRCVGYARPADRSLWAAQGLCSGPGRVTLQSWPGDSGGAVLNSDGELVGILLGGYGEQGAFGQQVFVPGKSRYCPLPAAWDWLELHLVVVPR